MLVESYSSGQAKPDPDVTSLCGLFLTQHLVLTAGVQVMVKQVAGARTVPRALDTERQTLTPRVLLTAPRLIPADRNDRH